MMSLGVMERENRCIVFKEVEIRSSPVSTNPAKANSIFYNFN